MQVRFARHTDRLDEVVRFYRDGLGLREIGRFADHDGYDGVFLAIPITETQLEFTTRASPGPPAPHPETLLVLYDGVGGEIERGVGLDVLGTLLELVVADQRQRHRDAEAGDDHGGDERAEEARNQRRGLRSSYDQKLHKSAIEAIAS
jgi:catechol 2,3-dioxygenase-like lactoylglutathione lyase family enzyme